MIELVCEWKQVSVWNKLAWNTSCGIGVRWEGLIRQVYWQWSTHSETTKRCDLVGLLKSGAAKTGITVLATYSSTLGSSGANFPWVWKPKWCSRKTVQRRCCKPSLVLSQVVRVREGSRTGFLHLNLGVPPDPSVPGTGNSERPYERGTERKGLEEVRPIRERLKMAGTKVSRGQSRALYTVYGLCVPQVLW